MKEDKGMPEEGGYQDMGAGSGHDAWAPKEGSGKSKMGGKGIAWPSHTEHVRVKGNKLEEESTSKTTSGVPVAY